MNQPAVSVIIPAYNQADFVGEAIQSVLDQSFTNFELIVVNDASPDRTAEVVKQYDDPRIHYVVHEVNRGLPAARNSGIRASSGEIIALLDADDLYHRDKLQQHVDFLTDNPAVGLAYNGRYELNYSDTTIRELIRPPLDVSLLNLVLGYPFIPSSTVIRKEWLLQVGLFDETLINGGEDLDLPARLALDGCKFAGIDRPLDYHRHHSARSRKNLAARLDEVLMVLTLIFANPRCPDEVKAVRDMAYAENHLVYGYDSLLVSDPILGHFALREAVRLTPTILDNNPCKLVRYLTERSIADEAEDHVPLLKHLFDQLPEELSWLSDQFDWAAAEGFLIKGTRAVVWGRTDFGQRQLSKAAEMGAKIDELYLQKLTSQLLAYEKEFGSESTEEILRDLLPYLRQMGGRAFERHVRGEYLLNKAFDNYSDGTERVVPGLVLRACFQNPQLLADRGTLSIFFRSLLDFPKRQSET